MAKNPKIKTARAWAIVTERGRILVDTCCKHRESALDIYTAYDREAGAKVRRVTVVVEMK